MLKRHGFTLIELLVVITIIVVLLALLTPAMDKAVYQAELAADAAQIDAMGTGVLTYAMEYGRAYPYRPPVHNGYAHGQATLVKQSTVADLRLLLGGYWSNRMYIDPFCPEVDLGRTDADANILGSYALWFDYGFTQPGGGINSRMGQGVRWDEQRYDLLVSDYDYVDSAGNAVFGSHPDADGVMVESSGLNGGVADPLGWIGKWSYSRWENWGNAKRGPIEMSFGYADGSVTRLDKVLRNQDPQTADERMAKLPRASAYNDTHNAWVQVPRR